MPYTQQQIDLATLRAHDTFKGRDAYFEWVRRWKEDYSRLSLEIRAQKKKTRVSYPDWREWYKLSEMKINARDLLLARKAGKIASWQQKMQKLEQQQAA